jgi:nitrogenase subunit NifH
MDVVADIVCAAFFTPRQFLQDFYIVTTHSQGREVICFGETSL